MAYIELHAHSHYSLLDGASSPDALIQRAAELGMPALALTDHDAVYGAIRFAQAAKSAGVRPLFGAELTLEGDHHLTLLVQNAMGWRNLCTLITQGRHNATKGEAALPFSALDGHTEGLIALSGCRKGLVASALLKADQAGALKAARRLQNLFGQGCFWIELQRHLLPDENTLITSLVDLAHHIGAGIVATNNVHYATREDRRLQDVLVCIRNNTKLEASAHLRRPNSEFYLKGTRQMQPLFARWPQALTNTQRIADQLDFDLGYGLQDLPAFPTPDALSASNYLRSLCLDALPHRFPDPASEVLARLEYELAVIERGGLSNYFLIVWDIVRYAREQGIRCQGRGSAANSLVAYLLGISPIDPLAHNLVFERFLSDERNLTPDIDIDFDAARREEVIQYVYQRYGHAHAAMACTFITFRARSAIRDVGKALGLPPFLIDQAAKAVEGYRVSQIGEQVEGDSLPWAQLLDLCTQIDGFPRHLGIHNGGLVITSDALASRLPTEPATMPDRYVVQWDKDSLEEAGLVKIDILGLRMLSVLSDVCDLAESSTGHRPDLDALTFDDPAVFDLISRADTIGVFQVESRAQSQMLPRFQPRRFNDLIVAISLIRPGPLQGNMVHPYLRRRLGEEEVSYFHPTLIPALEETLGVILFQEQVLKVARDLAGFTAGQGELLRRALGSKHASELMLGLHHAFIEGAVRKGIEEAVAEEVFEKLRGFGSYSFPKSHAAAFAVIVYQSAWLKVYHPLAFYVAILNNQPMGFWSPSVVLNDAKHHRIPVRRGDVNQSSAQCTIEDDALKLGLLYVDSIGEASAERIIEIRRVFGFIDLEDFCRRTHLPKRQVESLILAGAMDAFGERRKLIWELNRLHYQEEALDLPLPTSEFAPEPLSYAEAFAYEYDTLGLSVSEHPMSFYRARLDREGMASSDALNRYESGEVVRVGGMVIMHQAPPTAKGHHFITLEDEFGLINVIVRPDVYERYRPILRRTPLLIIEGEVQRKGAVTNLVARNAFRLSQQAA